MQPDPNAVAVARRVRAAIDDAGISAAEIARRVGKTQSYIARRMSGEVAFSAPDLISISVAAGVALQALLPDVPAATTGEATQ